MTVNNFKWVPKLLCYTTAQVNEMLMHPCKNYSKIAMKHKLYYPLCPFQVFHFIPQDLLSSTDLFMCAELTGQLLLLCLQSSLSHPERNINVYSTLSSLSSEAKTM